MRWVDNDDRWACKPNTQSRLFYKMINDRHKYCWVALAEWRFGPWRSLFEPCSNQLGCIQHPFASSPSTAILAWAANKISALCSLERILHFFVVVFVKNIRNRSEHKEKRNQRTNRASALSASLSFSFSLSLFWYACIFRLIVFIFLVSASGNISLRSKRKMMHPTKYVCADRHRSYARYQCFRESTERSLMQCGMEEPAKSWNLNWFFRTFFFYTRSSHRLSFRW